MTGPYLWAATWLWAAWALSWMAAALWVARSTKRAARSSYRLQLAIAFAGFGLLFLDPPGRVVPLWIVLPWLGWAMVGLVAAGLVFAWWARLHLGALWSGEVVVREGHRIVDTGPYALVRHPIYTGLIASGIGMAAIKATPLAMIGAALLALGFALKARIEEHFLATELGEAGYADYRSRVPMLIPFLGSPR